MKIKDLDGDQLELPVHACLVGKGITSVELGADDIRALYDATDEQRLAWIEKLACRLPMGEPS